jgi:hypothetical protein
MSTKLLRADGQLPVIGDDIDVPVSVSSVPGGVSITKAWLTFKPSSNRSAADDSVLQKILTSGFTGTTTVSFTFPLSKTDTAVFTPGTKYVFDVQVLDSSGKLSTPIVDGEAKFQVGVTSAVS